jgi:hypothetical protein
LKPKPKRKTGPTGKARSTTADFPRLATFAAREALRRKNWRTYNVGISTIRRAPRDQ